MFLFALSFPFFSSLRCHSCMYVMRSIRPINRYECQFLQYKIKIKIIRKFLLLIAFIHFPSLIHLPVSVVTNYRKSIKFFTIMYSILIFNQQLWLGHMQYSLALLHSEHLFDPQANCVHVNILQSCPYTPFPPPLYVTTYLRWLEGVSINLAGVSNSAITPTILFTDHQKK